MTQTLTDLHAEADRLLPPDRYLRVNALLKDNPDQFYVDARVKLPRGTTHKKLADLAKKIYLAKENA